MANNSKRLPAGYASIAMTLALSLAPPALSSGVAQAAGNAIPAGPLRYKVVASNARLNREVIGPVTRTVHGVPAEPVDSFVYDGVGSVEIEGHLTLLVDPVAEVGFIRVEWSDDNGDWTYWQDRFVHPEHLSGVRIGSSVNQVDFLINEGITENVYLHGDTGAGMPVLPTLFTHLATWGPADVTRNGQPFDNVFELPAPQWLGHVMVTEGVRQDDGSVRTRTGAIYHPGLGSEGAIETGGDLEVHFVFHDERFPMTGNIPPIFQFFYHMVFEDVAIEIIEADEPIPIEPPGQILGAAPDSLAEPARIELRGRR